MKQTQKLSFRVFSALCLVAIITFSCKKESVTGNNNSAGLKPIQENSTSQDFSVAAGPIDKLVGSYATTGTRILYIGNRADSIITAEINLSDSSPKTMSALNDTTLACDYADLGSSGWQYIITYDKVKKQIILTPNDVMASGIKLGSFITYSATFNRATRTFNFVTGYTNSSNNDRTVYETLVKQ